MSNKRRTATSTLRQRVIDEMLAIQELIASEHRSRGMGGDDDFRPSIVWHIVRIAELETMPPSRARKAFERIAKDEKRLKASLEKLPPRARRLVGLEVKGLDDAERYVKKETGRTAANRKRLAAEVAHDLILDYGSVVPTLTKDEPYIELANLLYFVATGKKGDLKKHCGQHFADSNEKNSTSILPREGPRGRRRD